MSDESEENHTISIRANPVKPPRAKRNREEAKDYCKTEPSMQDIISKDPNLVKDKLKGYERIPVAQYAELEAGTFIRYVMFDQKGNPKIRLGGYIIKNGAPDYWVLRSGAKGKSAVTWSVPLKCNLKQSSKANVYFRKAGLASRGEKEQAGLELYEAVKSGRYQLIDTSKLPKPERPRRFVQLEGAQEQSHSPKIKTKVNFLS